MGGACSPHSHPSENQHVWNVAVSRKYLLIPHAEFKSSTQPHLLLHANYVLILFENLWQIYEATPVLTAPSYTQSGTEVYQNKNNKKNKDNINNKKTPWHGQENKPKPSHNILFF